MGQGFSSDSPPLPLLQAAWDLYVNNETFSWFNQMQFCKRFLWFSKSIKNDICSALTLVRSSTEHKHWKLLGGEEDIKILLPCVVPAWSWATWRVSEFFSVHWLGAAPGCCRDKTYIFIVARLSYALPNYVLRYRKSLSLTGWGTRPFRAEGLVNEMSLVQGTSCKTARVPTGPSHYPLYLLTEFILVLIKLFQGLHNA